MLKSCPGLGPVFRTLHGRRIVCMSLTLSVITKIITEGTLLLHDAAELDGSRLQTLPGRWCATNLTVETTMETQGMVPNLWND